MIDSDHGNVEIEASESFRVVGAYNPAGLYPTALVPVFECTSISKASDVLFHQILGPDGAIVRFESIPGISKREINQTEFFRCYSNSLYNVGAKRCIAIGMTPRHIQFFQFADINLEGIVAILEDIRLFRNPKSAITIINHILQYSDLQQHGKDVLYSSRMAALIAGGAARDIAAGSLPSFVRLDSSLRSGNSAKGQRLTQKQLLSAVKEYLADFEREKHGLWPERKFRFTCVALLHPLDDLSMYELWESIGKLWPIEHTIPVIFLEMEPLLPKVCDLRVEYGSYHEALGPNQSLDTMRSQKNSSARRIVSEWVRISQIDIQFHDVPAKKASEIPLKPGLKLERIYPKRVIDFDSIKFEVTNAIEIKLGSQTKKKKSKRFDQRGFQYKNDTQEHPSFDGFVEYVLAEEEVTIVSIG